MISVRYTTPFPPMANNLYRNVPGRGRVRTERYRTSARAAGNQILAQKPQHIAGPVELHIKLCKPDKRRRDLSNGVKALEDLLVDMGIIDDDRHVERLVVEWGGEEGAVIEVCEAQ